MKFFVRAIVTGFALSLGSALFKKVSAQLGLDDKAKDKDREKGRDPASEVNVQDGATDPGLQHKFS